MRKYKDVIDLVRRRLDTYFQSDCIDTVFAEMDESKPLEYTFRLKEYRTPAALACIEVKYKRIFDDKSNDIDIKVIGPTDYFRRSKTTFVLYENGEWFSLSN